MEYSFALTNDNVVADKQRHRPARVRGVLSDFGLLDAWLHRCETEHHQDCPGTWSDELLTTRMMDIVSRTAVGCRPHCRYIALSYVWGGVVPEADALQKHQQLEIMDLIYSGTEHELATVFPPCVAEEQDSQACRSVRGRCRSCFSAHRCIVFGRDQVHYACRWMHAEETVDETKDPAKIMDTTTSSPYAEATGPLQSRTTRHEP